MNSKLLIEKDYIEAAKILNVDVACIKAVAEVESRGDGFLKDGRPKILFEAHIFGKLTKYKFNNSHPYLSSLKWNKTLYKGGAKEYNRLVKAKSLDTAAALKSTSWGKFQVMGFNYKICGWKTIDDFVKDMFITEREHLLSFIGFVKSLKLDKYLKSLDWTKFAYYYNGPGYKKNFYDIKMKKAYEKYKKQKIDIINEKDIPQPIGFDTIKWIKKNNL